MTESDFVIVYAAAAYPIGSGLEQDHTQDTWSSGKMMTVRETEHEDFAAYCAHLEAMGYVCDSRSTLKGRSSNLNECAQYVRGLSVVYAYYTPSQKTVRVIEDRAGVAESSFEYTVAHDGNTPADVVLYGLKMHPQGINNEPGGDPDTINCGALLLVTQADGSLFVVDGGGIQQAADAAVEGLLAYMRKITDAPAGEKVRISCWFITHGHGDHHVLNGSKSRRPARVGCLLFTVKDAEKAARIGRLAQKHWSNFGAIIQKRRK